MKKVKKLNIILILAIVLAACLVSSLECFAVSFDNEYPLEWGIASGNFIRFTCSLSNNCCVLLCDDDLGNIVFTTDNQILNIQNSVVYCDVFIGNQSYRGRLQARGYLEISGYNSLNTWTSVTMRDITDTNIKPEKVSPDYDKLNDSLYLDSFQLIVVCCLITLIFFTVLNWIMLHKHLL